MMGENNYESYVCGFWVDRKSSHKLCVIIADIEDSASDYENLAIIMLNLRFFSKQFIVKSI